MSRRAECSLAVALDAHDGKMNGCSLPQHSDAGAEAALNEGLTRIVCGGATMDGTVEMTPK